MRAAHVRETADARCKERVPSIRTKLVLEPGAAPFEQLDRTLTTPGRVHGAQRTRRGDHVRAVIALCRRGSTNGLVRGVRDPSHWAVVLDTFGTARDLSNAGITLHEGCALVVYDWSDEEEDLEGDATVHFDFERRRWVAELGARGYRYVPKRDRTPVRAFLCVGCRRDLGLGLTRFGEGREGAIIVGNTHRKPIADRCPSCATTVSAAIAPPPE